MNLFYVNLVAGIASTFDGITGRYLRIMDGPGEVEFEVRYERGSIKSKIVTGIGIDLSHPDTQEPFKSIIFKSDADKQIRVLVSHFPSTDSRLVGDLNLNGTMNVINQVASVRALGQQAYGAAAATQILPTDLNRLKTAVTFNTDVYLGIDNTVTNLTGWFWPAGQIWIDENQAPLWVYGVGAGTAKFIQDKK
jgi:hypothetical protein